MNNNDWNNLSIYLVTRLSSTWNIKIIYDSGTLLKIVHILGFENH